MDKEIKELADKIQAATKEYIWCNPTMSRNEQIRRISDVLVASLTNVMTMAEMLHNIYGADKQVIHKFLLKTAENWINEKNEDINNMLLDLYLNERKN